MSTTLQPPETTEPTSAAVGPGLDRARLRRWGLFLLAAAAWNAWVWTTRAVNLLQDDRDFTLAFVVVHLLLFAVSFAIAAGLAVVGWRLRRAGGAA